MFCPVHIKAVAYVRNKNRVGHRQTGEFSSVSVTANAEDDYIAIFGNAEGVSMSDSVVSITLDNWEGMGYTQDDVGSQVTIAPCNSNGCNSATAEISSVRNDGRVRSIRVTNGGSGYTSVPQVTMPDPIGKTCCAAYASATLNARTGES